MTKSLILYNLFVRKNMERKKIQYEKQASTPLLGENKKYIYCVLLKRLQYVKKSKSFRKS